MCSTYPQLNHQLLSSKHALCYAAFALKLAHSMHQLSYIHKFVSYNFFVFFYSKLYQLIPAIELYYSIIASLQLVMVAVAAAAAGAAAAPAPAPAAAAAQVQQS